MLTTFKRRIAKLESLRKKAGPMRMEDWLTDAQDYAQRTGVSLDEAIMKVSTDVSIDDLRRFCDELESAFQLSQDMPPQASVT